MHSILYVGCYTTPQPHVHGTTGSGIGIFSLNSQSSALKNLSTVPAGIDPSFLTVTHNKKFLYAVNEIAGATGRILGFKIGASGTQLEQIANVSSKGVAPCYVSTDARDEILFANNYMTGSALTFRIGQDGTLTEDKFFQFPPLPRPGPVPDRQEGPHAHCFLTDISGKFAYCADLGSDKIWTFKVQNGTVTPLNDPTRCPAGSGPRHIVFHPNDRYAYVVCELGCEVLVMEKNDQTGALVEKQAITTLPSPGDKTNKGAAEIHCTPDGRYLYVSTRDLTLQSKDIITYYAINGSTGLLTTLGHVSSGGMIPRNFVIEQGHVYVANQDSSDIVTFKIDPGSGTLQRVGGKVQSPTPVCLKFVSFANEAPGFNSQSTHNIFLFVALLIIFIMYV